MSNTEKVLAEFESFDSFFAGLSMQDEDNAMKLYEKYVQSFIATSIHQAIAEERESVREKAKKLKKDSTFFSVYRADYNEALDDLLSSLNKPIDK